MAILAVGLAGVSPAEASRIFISEKRARQVRFDLS